MVDWGRLLSGCRGNTSTAGSNPALPAFRNIRYGTTGSQSDKGLRVYAQVAQLPLGDFAFKLT